MARTPLTILRAAADERISSAAAEVLHEAVELLRDRFELLVDDLDTYMYADERTERAEAKGALAKTAGEALAELTAFNVPTPTTTSKGEPT